MSRHEYMSDYSLYQFFLCCYRWYFLIILRLFIFFSDKWNTTEISNVCSVSCLWGTIHLSCLYQLGVSGKESYRDCKHCTSRIIDNENTSLSQWYIARVVSIDVSIFQNIVATLVIIVQHIEVLKLSVYVYFFWIITIIQMAADMLIHSNISFLFLSKIKF